MREKLRAYRWNIVLLVLAAGVLAGSVVSADGPGQLLETLRRVRPAFLWGAAGCMAAYWGLECLSLHAAALRLHPGQRLRDSLQVSMVGQLFNCITPFASGGQPMQACQLARRGMPLGSASSALMVKSIVYQVVLSLYSLATLVLRFGFFTRSVDGFGPLILTGFAVNTAVVAALLGVCFFPRAAERCAALALRALCRLRLVKDKEKASAAVSRELAGFYEGFRILRKSPLLLSRLCLLTAAQLTAFFAVPYCVCRALGAAVPSAFTVIAAGAFVLMVSSFVPLPGASGGAEGSFFVLFRMFFLTSGAAGAAVVLWRAFTFYLPIAVGICFAAGGPAKAGLPSGARPESSSI